MIKKGIAYYRTHGLAAFVRAVYFRLFVAKKIRRLQALTECKSIDELVDSQFFNCRALPVVWSKDGVRRVNFLTDSINGGSLFGGVGTGIAIAVLLAKELKAGLRIVTRTESPERANVSYILKMYGMESVYAGLNIEFSYCDVHNKKHNLPVTDEDIFITSSWWTTASAMKSIARENLVYLLQEDERMFYAHGDEHAYATQIMSESGIRFLINTRLLYDHLVGQGFENLRDRATVFEPGCNKEIFHRGEISGKKKLVFYARPNNPRNLFWLGLQALDMLISSGHLDIDEWEIVFIGKDVPDLAFSSGYKPVYRLGLSWGDYAKLLSTSSVGLSLMYTPHPSYPPLDMANCGMLVVTSCFGNKQSLSQYSDLIHTYEPTVDAIFDGLVEMVARAERGTTTTPVKPCGESWPITLSAAAKEVADVLN